MIGHLVRAFNQQQQFSPSLLRAAPFALPAHGFARAKRPTGACVWLLRARAGRQRSQAASRVLENLRMVAREASAISTMISCAAAAESGGKICPNLVRMITCLQAAEWPLGARHLRARFTCGHLILLRGLIFIDLFSFLLHLAALVVLIIAVSVLVLRQ